MTAKIKGQKAQGDVLLTPVEGPPENARLAKEKRTLALGEVTGHHHSFADDVDLYEVAGDPRRWVLLEQSEVLEHQEHAAITFDPGWYVYDPQVEVDPFTGLARRVQD